MFDNEYDDFWNYNMMAEKEDERLANMSLWELFNCAELEIMQEFPSFNEVDNEELLRKQFRQGESDEYPHDDNASLFKFDSPSAINLFTPSTNVDLYEFCADEQNKGNDEPCWPALNHLDVAVLRNGTESDGKEESEESVTVVVDQCDEQGKQANLKHSKKDGRFGKQADRGKI